MTNFILRGGDGGSLPPNNSNPSLSATQNASTVSGRFRQLFSTLYTIIA